MDDMNALERQLANVVQGAMRPPRPVDASAIVRTATTGAPTDRLSAISRRFRGGSVPVSAERGFSMFTAVKFVAAAAIVALFGGFLLASITGDPRETAPLPAAVSPSPSASTVEVTVPEEFVGRITCGTHRQDGQSTDVVVGSVDGGKLIRRETRGQFGEYTVDEMSDARFDGTHTLFMDTDEYFFPGSDPIGYPLLRSSVHRIENDGGAWQSIGSVAYLPGSTASGSYLPYTAPLADRWLLVGEGAHDGLTATWEMSLVEPDCYCWDQGHSEFCSWDLRGLVFEGDPPAAPGAPSAGK